MGKTEVKLIIHRVIKDTIQYIPVKCIIYLKHKILACLEPQIYCHGWSHESVWGLEGKKMGDEWRKISKGFGG